MDATVEIYERILGGLIGVAVGDAFGMPSEMWSQERIQKYFGIITDFLPGPKENIISRNLLRGEVTDDTINTMLVVEMLEETNGEVDPIVLVDKIRQWAKETPKSVTVIGPSTSKAFALLDSGVPIEETGKAGTTNGGAMKVLPIGLVADITRIDLMVDEVHKLCMPTHNTVPAISGAAAIAAAAAYAVYGDKDIDKLLDFAKEAAVLGMNRGHDIATPSIARRIELGRTLVKNARNEKMALKDIYDIIGTGLPTTESVPAALSLVYLAKGDPMKCAIYSANIGGDTDTIGAMACGICGAFSGANVFSNTTVNLLENVNKISFKEMAEILYKIVIS
jgi:ADP-ribosylglycohydrolase